MMLLKRLAQQLLARWRVAATVAPQSVGMELRGRVMVNTALNLLEQAAAMLGGSRSEDGADVLSAVLKLRKRFGAVSRDLTQQDAKLIASRAAPVSAPPQQGPMGMPQMARRRMASMGMGGGQGG